jgi:hypothetical protein
MCGDSSSPQQGLPLDDAAFARLTPVCREFIEDLMQQVDEEITPWIERGEKKPYIPTDSLQAKYWQAIDEFLLGRFCPIIQLSQLFVFVRPSKS